MRLVAALCWSALAPLSLLGALDGGTAAAPPATLPGERAESAAAPGLQPDQAESAWLAYVREHREGARLAEARRYFDERIAADLREPALIEPTRHRLRLVAAANAGSLKAAARLVALSWWDAMQRVDIGRPQLAAWKDSAEACEAMVAGQVYAQLWLEHQGRHLDYLNAFPAEVRAQWLALAGRWPLRHPVLLANACWLCLGNQPALGERGDMYLQQALVALANDPLLVSDDLLACEGRALAYARCAPLLAAEDREAAVAIFAGAFVRNSERGAWAAAGIDRAAQLMLPFSDDGTALDSICEGLAEAESLFARAGDIVRQGRCQTQLIFCHHRQLLGAGPEDWAALEARYRSAAGLCRRSGDWLGFASALQQLGWFMVVREDASGLSRRGAEVFAEAAAAFARADEPQQRAYCLHCQVMFLESDKGKEAKVDLRAVAALQRDVEASFALTDVVGDRVANLCDLGDSLGDLADRGGALQAYQQAAELMRTGADRNPDRLRRVRSGMHDFAK